MNRPAHSVVRDPVHGDIYLTREELAILDTPDMQRLRGVRQLGTAYLVYPGAQHTRFEHSLGTLHMTRRLVEAINVNRGLAPGSLIGIADDEARILRAAALVHDVTHVPFGHSIEDQSGILERHDTPERYRRALDPSTAVGGVLEAMGVRREVLATLADESAPDLPTVPHAWREILSDTVCADILDYLRRDAYYTGLNLLYDDRVVNYFKVDRAGGHLYVDLAKRGLIRQDTLSELLRVLDARYFFSERVYYHHAKDAAGAMVSAVVEGALQAGMPVDELQRQTDDSLLHLVLRYPPPDPGAADRHRLLAEGLRSRRLLKRACVFPMYANRDVQERLLARFFSPGRQTERAEFEEEVRARLASRRGSGRLRAAGGARPVGASPASAEPPIVLLYCPARRMQLVEALTHVRFPEPEAIRPLAAFSDRIPHLAELERAYRDLWRLYVLAGTDDRHELAAIAAVVADMLPEARNVYDPLGG